MTRPLTNLITALLATGAQADPVLTEPIAPPDLVFEEVGGLVTVEAEHFFKQEKADVRAWYLTTAEREPKLTPDADPSHVAGAGGGAYLEVLPDTRRNHDEPLVHGENFSNDPGRMAVLSYKVHFNTPGKYHVWARTHSTGTEDNGLHAGIDGTWPESGQRMQWTAKNQWAWASKQRTQEVHTGVPGQLFLQVETAGEHVIQFSMREDGFEFDQWLMTTDPGFQAPDGPAPASNVRAGTVPRPLPVAKALATAGQALASTAPPAMTIHDFAQRERLYVDQGKWLAIDPAAHQSGKASGEWVYRDGDFDLTLHAAGENDGESKYELFVDDEKVGEFVCPLGPADEITATGEKLTKRFEGVQISDGAKVEVVSAIGTKDGQDHSRARWSHLAVAPADGKPLGPRTRGPQRPVEATGPNPKEIFQGDLFGERQPDGDGSVEIGGALKQWHKVTLTLDGPFAHEKDNKPNPFTDYRMTARFTHESGAPAYEVPGYFAADGEAGESSAESGTKWKAHLSPDRPGKWAYEITLAKGRHAALDQDAEAEVVHDDKGEFTIAPTDKAGRDLRATGRLEYVGKHHLQFAGSKEYFLKAGADAPETFLAYADFDGTVANNPRKCPLKTWEPHVKDWKPGDPSWKDGKGKGMIGAIDYLSGKGCNVFSFLPYNAGGDGDNVWPFISRNDKMHYDCSKLDQWGIVFDHATARGMYLHFKMQETEMDDDVPTSLDGGDLGPERKLYCRELIARFGHNLALNWNLGEENTQSTEQQRAMAKYIHDIDPYDHLIVVHTYPDQQEKVYRPLLGDGSVLRGASLQNSNVKDCHSQVVKWTRESAATGVPWVIGFDEPGTASEGMPADPGYPGMPDNFDNPSIHDTRKYALWGTIMAGGGGIEYYFGYKLPQNDLLCEDWRSRDRSWDYCRIALEFFKDHQIPFAEMRNEDELVGNNKHDNSAYCYAKMGEIYLVYLPNGGKRELDLTEADGEFQVSWFNPRDGGELKKDATSKGGAKIALEAPDANNDWLAVVRR